MQNLKGYTAMPSENKRSFHSHNIASKLRIFQNGCLEDSDFYLGLLLKLFLAFYELQSNKLLFFMIKCPENTAERPSTKLRYYLISISNTIVYHNFRVSLVISKIRLSVNSSWPHEIDLIMCKLLFFKGS